MDPVERRLFENVKEALDLLPHQNAISMSAAFLSHASMRSSVQGTSIPERQRMEAEIALANHLILAVREYFAKREN